MKLVKVQDRIVKRWQAKGRPVLGLPSLFLTGVGLLPPRSRWRPTSSDESPLRLRCSWPHLRFSGAGYLKITPSRRPAAQTFSFIAEIFNGRLRWHA